MVIILYLRLSGEGALMNRRDFLKVAGVMAAALVMLKRRTPKISARPLREMYVQLKSATPAIRYVTHIKEPNEGDILFPFTVRAHL